MKLKVCSFQNCDKEVLFMTTWLTTQTRYLTGKLEIIITLKFSMLIFCSILSHFCCILTLDMLKTNNLIHNLIHKNLIFWLIIYWKLQINIDSVQYGNVHIKIAKWLCWKVAQFHNEMKKVIKVTRIKCEKY